MKGIATRDASDADPALANLTPAQRDDFRAHIYGRIDRPRGQFCHTNWTGRGGDVMARAHQA